MMKNKKNIDLDKRSYLIGFADAIEQYRFKETCKWEKYKPRSYPQDWPDPPIMYRQSCGTDGLLSRKQDDFKWCPYCGREIEEVKL